MRTLRLVKMHEPGRKGRRAEPLSLRGRTARLRSTCVVAVAAVIGSMLGVVVPSGPANATNACPPSYALITGGGIALRTNCGTSARQLSTGQEMVQPALSPDGSQVAFVRRDSSANTDDVWTVSAAGGTAAQVTHVGWTAVWSVGWTADSRLVLTAGTFPIGSGTTGSIYTVNPDGTGLTSVAPSFQAFGATWCGSKIVVEHYDQYAVPQLYAMNTDGSGITQITSGSIESYEAACTPDNRWVIFKRYDNIDTPNVNGLYAVPITGGSPVLLRPDGTGGTEYPTVSDDWTMAFVSSSPDGSTSGISLQWLGGTAVQFSGPGDTPSFAHGSSTTPAPTGFPVAYGSTTPTPAAFKVVVDDSSVGKVFGTGEKVLKSQASPSTACRSGWLVSTKNNTDFVLHTPTGGNVTGTRVSYLSPQGF